MVIGFSFLAFHGRAECFVAGECQKSSFIGSEVSSDEFACLGLCKSTAGCNWFTFFPSTGFCQLFEDCAELNSDICPDCISGDVP